MIFSHSNIFTRVKFGASLSDNDISRYTVLSSIELYAQVFRVGVFVVLSGATLFL